MLLTIVYFEVRNKVSNVSRLAHLWTALVKQECHAPGIYRRSQRTPSPAERLCYQSEKEFELSVRERYRVGEHTF